MDAGEIKYREGNCPYDSSITITTNFNKQEFIWQVRSKTNLSPPLGSLPGFTPPWGSHAPSLLGRGPPRAIGDIPA